MIVEVRNITLNKTSLTLQPDNTVTLIATVLPSNAMDKTVTWTSSNTSVATVDNSGVVTALSDGAADITAQAGSKTATCTVNVISETGIIINGVTWATRNVDAPGTFAASPESFGMLYQWNRNVGWSAENPLKNSDGGDDWDSSTPSGVAWIAANDPSPAGWHIPTQEELKTLLDKDNVTSEWTTLNRIPGRRFTDKNTGTSIFLPAVGLRDGYGTGALENAGSAGYYWSNEQSGSSRGYCMTFENNSVNMYASWRYYGFSVRPVKE
jgi:uncharacterized protein (TIGR02145 family)